jgi:ribosomal protein S18 acetylase RimI-like enzyme
VLIRKATPEDLPRIRSLEQQSETAAHWKEREYDALFAPDAPARLVIVAADEGDPRSISGFAVARCGQDEDEWEIENVVVASEQRRHGLGTALVKEVLRKAHTSRAASVLLEVRESNLAARFLYEKLGFSEIGRRQGYYQNPPEAGLVLQISVTDV